MTTPASPRGRTSSPGLVAAAGLGLLLVWTAIAFTWTESSERTSIELARDVHHLGVLVLALLVYRRRTAPAAIAGAATAAVAICALALASRLDPGAFPVDYVRRNFGGNRLSYPLAYWNAVAAWGAMASAMALAWSAHARSATARAAALAAVPLCVTTVYLTYSRAGVAGIALGTLIVLLASRTRAIALLQAAVAAGASYLAIHAIRQHPAIVNATGGRGGGTVLVVLLAGMVVCAIIAAVLARGGADRRLAMPRRPARVAAIGGLVVVVAVGAAVVPAVARKGWHEFKQQPAPLTSHDPAARLNSLNGNRYNLYRSAWHAFQADPNHGTGPGTYEYWWNRDALNDESLRDAHSLYFEALAEMGWPGLLCVLLLCVGGLVAIVLSRVRAASRVEAGAATAALAGFGLWLFHAGVDWMWEETAVTVLALVLLGAAAAREGIRLPAPRLWVRIPLALGCLVLVLVQLPPVSGTSLVRKSQREFAAGAPAAAARTASDAVAAWPWAASPYLQRALVLEGEGDLRAAAIDARRAQRREPTNWRIPLVLARVDAARGRPRVALADYRRARRLRPLSAVFQRTPG